MHLGDSFAMKMNIARNLEPREYRDEELIAHYNTLIDTKLAMIKDVFPPEEGSEEEAEEGGDGEGEGDTEEATEAEGESANEGDASGEDKPEGAEGDASEDKDSNKADADSADEQVEGLNPEKQTTSNEANDDQVSGDKLSSKTNEGEDSDKEDTQKPTRQIEPRSDSRTLEIGVDEKESKSYGGGSIDGSSKLGEAAEDDYNKIKKEDDEIVQKSREGEAPEGKTGK